ncbi:hypothetical protein AYI70_g3242 [Smittium culicis]|uniref:Uncharacterized protein n=1 Tax=Smittium culicis TaxID=133412 RepID=A0A1R1Y4I6_9FUNG|nr:hypothetical protein AYI70_g3242 [Smittium culicis]
MSFFGKNENGSSWGGMLKQALSQVESKLDKVLEFQPEDPSKQPQDRNNVESRRNDRSRLAKSSVSNLRAQSASKSNSTSAQGSSRQSSSNNSNASNSRKNTSNNNSIPKPNPKGKIESANSEFPDTIMLSKSEVTGSFDDIHLKKSEISVKSHGRTSSIASLKQKKKQNENSDVSDLFAVFGLEGNNNDASGNESTKTPKAEMIKDSTNNSDFNSNLPKIKDDSLLNDLVFDEKSFSSIEKSSSLNSSVLSLSQTLKKSSSEVFSSPQRSMKIKSEEMVFKSFIIYNILLLFLFLLSYVFL